MQKDNDAGKISRHEEGELSAHLQSPSVHSPSGENPDQKENYPKKILDYPDQFTTRLGPLQHLSSQRLEQPICNHGPSKSRADLLRWMWSSTASSQVPGTWLPRKASLHLMTCESSMPVYLVSKVLLRPWSGTIGCGFARRSRLSHQEKVLTD